MAAAFSYFPPQSGEKHRKDISTMQHIFVDFEMNAIPKKNTEAWAVFRSEIIEIGAVKPNEQ